MRIAMVIGTSNWTGAEQHVLYLAQGLKELGHDVYIVCRYGSQLAVRAAGNYEVLELPLRNVFDLKSIFKLAKFIRQKKIDIVHTHHNKVGWIALFASKFACRGIVVNSLHMVPWAGKNDFLHRWYYNQFAAIICPSDAVCQSFIHYNTRVDVSKLFTAHLGIDTTKYAVSSNTNMRKSLGIALDDFVIGFAGRISPDKGIEYLLEAVGLVNRSEVKLLIAGTEDKGHMQVVREIIDKYKMKKQVIFLGFVENMAEFFNTIDLFALPSAIPEAFGQAPCEAMAAGKAVIVSDYGALPELIENNKQGFIVARQNADKIAVVLEWACNHRIEIKEMGTFAKRHVEDKFSLVAMAKRVVKIYESCNCK